MSEHLKCPFCGGVGVITSDCDMLDTGSEYCWPACLDCGVEPTEVFPTEEDAWEWWDTRCKP